MSANRIKKDDIVIVNTGKSAGKTGKVLAIDLKKQRAVVEGLNLVKKNIRKSQENPEGAIIDVPASIHLSNLMPYDPKAKKGVRVSHVREVVRVREDGKTISKSIRVAKGSGHRFE